MERRRQGKQSSKIKTESRLEWLKEYLEAEREKIQDLPRDKKIQYIINYYWLWILGIVTAISLLCYVIYRMNFAVSGYWFYAMYANTSAEAGDGSELWKDFRDYAGLDTSQKNLEMNAASWFDPSKTGGTANSYFQAYVALTEAGELDVVTMEREGLTALGQSGRLLDLNREECAALREKYGDRLVWCRPYDEEYFEETESASVLEGTETEGETAATGAEIPGDAGTSGGIEAPEDGMVPVGIDVSDSLLMTKYNLYEDSCVLGISAYTNRLDMVETFLEFIYSE